MKKKLTISADSALIEKAQRRAAAEQTTLDAQFQIWLETYVRSEQESDRMIEPVREPQASIFTGGRTFSREELQAGIFTGGRTFTREEMNEKLFFS